MLPRRPGIGCEYWERAPNVSLGFLASRLAKNAFDAEGRRCREDIEYTRPLERTSRKFLY